MASGSKVPTKKQYISSKRSREPDFDPLKFISAAAFKVFSEILPQEQLTDCYYFNFQSLLRAKIDIRKFFSTLGIDRFVESKEPIYPGLVRKFYANLYVGDDEGSPSLVLKSLVNGTSVTISSEILNTLFGLSMDGYDCSGKYISEEMEISELDISGFLCSKAVIEVTDDVFENNDFGIRIRLLLVALTKCLMPKVNTQHKLVGIDRHVTYHALNENAIDFASIVTNWMKVKGEVFRSKRYAGRTRKVGMPFGSVLTALFRHNNVDLSSEPSIPVSRGHEISDSTLTAMHYVETINRGWVLFSYLREDDQVHQGTRTPTHAERITRRGPDTLLEIQAAALARRSKSKGKSKIPAKVEKDIVARIQNVQNTQLQIRQDIQSIRSEVQDLQTSVHGIQTLLTDFIRFSKPTFPFPSSRPNDLP
ncbi:hypothetical protein OROGR_004688 [Orobanche gracilis]